MINKVTFAQRTREKYGDTVEQFAFRLCASVKTVEGWEKGKTPGQIHASLLNYAYKYELTLKHDAPEEFVKMNATQQINYLMKYYGESINSVATRLGLASYTLMRWKATHKISPSAQRLLYEAAAHPNNFQLIN